MKLLSAQVEHFKSIENTEQFSVDDVTCLVGKNESGKTAILQALYKLNPVVPSAADFNPTYEYPKRHLTDYLEVAEEHPANVITTRWQLEPEDVASINEISETNVSETDVVTIRKGYDNQIACSITVDEQAAVDQLIKDSGLNAVELQRLRTATTVGELIQRLNGLPNPSDREQRFKTLLDERFPEEDLNQAVISKLKDRLPKFLYFAELDRMPGIVSINDIVKKKEDDRLTAGERIFEALLELTNTSIDDLGDLDQYEDLNAQIRAVSNRISNEIFDYWSQNSQLRVLCDFRNAESGDQPPYNEGRIFHTRIENMLHLADVSFNERSTGFVWFFSFLVWFSQISRTYGDNLIILLDEPGLGLHAKAQGDLLRYIRDKLAPDHQVIYTTHSPFMVDTERILSNRTVEDKSTQRNVIGTKVGDKVLSTDSDTLFPMQAAIGYEVTQGLFIGRHTLLVEGSSDLHYLKWFSRELEKRHRTFLDPRWVIAPVRGIDRMSAFATLFSANRLHLAALVDFHSGDKRKIENLRSMEEFEDNHVISCEQYTNTPEADIEDVIGWIMYSDILNRWYRLSGKDELKELPDGYNDRIMPYVEDHFRVLPPHVENFDHNTPAESLVQDTEFFSKHEHLDDALERFEKMFEDLNKLLPE